MTDNQMAALFMAQVLPAMQAQTSLAGVALAQNFQRRAQGASSTSIVYFFKVADRRYGWTGRRDDYDVPSGEFAHTDSQQYETTYQFSALVPQDPSNVASLTESDVLNMVSSIMQTDALLSAFRAAGVGVQRITDVRNPFIVDDRDRFEAVPSFDIVLTHYRDIVSTVGEVTTYDAELHRV